VFGAAQLDRSFASRMDFVIAPATRPAKSRTASRSSGASVSSTGQAPIRSW
jgi:hypothetical protein